MGLNGFAYGLGAVGTLGYRYAATWKACRPAPPSTTFQMSRSALAPLSIMEKKGTGTARRVKLLCTSTRLLPLVTTSSHDRGERSS